VIWPLLSEEEQAGVDASAKRLKSVVAEYSAAAAAA
jgi:hypothetical protein